MDSDLAELSALAATLDDLTRRITGIGDRYHGSPRTDVAEGIYEVERSLLTAARQLERVLRSLG
ncbi:MAG TPA: hypothetical protein VE575_15150 [Acidimicrobiales bacterium]|jgi:hypothetical protein|nr:hypothetical protein [Acidimicrobiales bacterium]